MACCTDGEKRLLSIKLLVCVLYIYLYTQRWTVNCEFFISCSCLF